jgi:replication factor C subunit 2/4
MSKISDNKQDKKFMLPWIEKYRPFDIEDVILPPTIKEQIKTHLKEQSVTHLILNGDPGVGKTSTAKCIAKYILGVNMKEGFLELNASNDRGIKTISTVLPPFCMKKVSFTQPKIILLDEADNITNKAQHEITKLMRIYSGRVKFIMTCNTTSKIIEYIQSNSSKIFYHRMTRDQTAEYLHKISIVENVKYTPDGLDAIIYASMGDMRKAINYLQTIHHSYGIVTKENVYKICEYPNPDLIIGILNTCKEKNLKDAINKVIAMKYQGNSSMDILIAFSAIIPNYAISEEEKIKIMHIINSVNVNISAGIDSDLQLISMISKLILAF